MDEKQFLDFHTEELKKLYIEHRIAFWNASGSGKEEDYKAYEEAGIAITKFFNNKERFEQSKKLSQHAKDPLVRRQLELLQRAYLSEQGDLELREELIKQAAAIEKTFNTFRAVIDGKEHTDNELKEILRKEKDGGRLHAAWEANKKQGAAVEQQVIAVVKLRNKLAQELGFKNYYRFALELQEQSEEQVAAVLDELAELTDEPYRELKDNIDEYLSKHLSISQSELRPWHYQDIFMQEGPEIYPLNLDTYYNKDPLPVMKEFYAGVGLPVEGVLEKSDLYERKGKYQHAYCLDVDRDGDVRIMQSTKNDEYWLSTTLHELGHGVHFYYMNKQLPWLLRDAHTLITESISMLFGRLSKDKYFLQKYGTITPHELTEVAPNLRRSLRLSMLVFSRWVQVMFNFERQLYADPDQDLNRLWWSLVKRYQLIDFSRDAPDWASKIHLAQSPAYYQNYMFGELLASQHHHHIMKRLGAKSMDDVNYLGHTEVGEYLRNGIFALGESLPWDELIEKATGEKLNPKYFAEQFT